jgi:hypothetical protein
MHKLVTKSAPEPIGIEYYADRKLCPNNLEVSRDSMHEFMVVKHGKFGTIINTGEYYKKPAPDKPGILYETDPAVVASVEYRMAESSYLDAARQVNRHNAKAIDDRSVMFGDIFSALRQSARDQMATDPTYRELLRNADDPLALWKLAEVKLSSVTVNNVVASKGASKLSYNTYRQGPLMPIEEFYRGFCSRVETMGNHGWSPMGDEQLAYDFLYKLSTAKFSSLIESVENGIIPSQKVGVLQCVGEQRSVGAVCIAPVQDIGRGDDRLVTDGVIRLV